MKVKAKRRMTRFQFEKMFPNAETSTGYSWEVQEEPAKIANINCQHCGKPVGRTAVTKYDDPRRAKPAPNQETPPA